MASALRRGFVSWWHTRPPRDETTRPQWAHAFVNRNIRIVLPICLLILTGGAFFKPLTWWQVVVMSFFGMLDARMMLKGLRGYGQWNAYLATGPFMVPGAILVVPTLGVGHELYGLGIVSYAVFWSMGTNAFLCWLFHEPFLRYIEAPADDPAPLVPQKFDY